MKFLTKLCSWKYCRCRFLKSKQTIRFNLFSQTTPLKKKECLSNELDFCKRGNLQKIPWWRWISCQLISKWKHIARTIISQSSHLRDLSSTWRYNSKIIDHTRVKFSPKLHGILRNIAAYCVVICSSCGIGRQIDTGFWD